MNPIHSGVVLGTRWVDGVHLAPAWAWGEADPVLGEGHERGRARGAGRDLEPGLAAPPISSGCVGDARKRDSTMATPPSPSLLALAKRILAAAEKLMDDPGYRSEERRVGKECRSRW